MGFKRFLKHLVFKGSHTIDMVSNIVDEKDIVGGIKRTVKEDLTEDFPITSVAYHYGKTEGKKEGYLEAATEYEKKLLQQADDFLSQKRSYTLERDKYEKLLDDYEDEIKQLSRKLDKTTAEKELFQEFLLRERELKLLRQ